MFNQEKVAAETAETQLHHTKQSINPQMTEVEPSTKEGHEIPTTPETNVFVVPYLVLTGLYTVIYLFSKVEILHSVI